MCQWVLGSQYIERKNTDKWSYFGKFYLGPRIHEDVTHTPKLCFRPTYTFKCPIGQTNVHPPHCQTYSWTAQGTWHRSKGTDLASKLPSFKMLILTLFFHTTYTLSITRTKSHPKFNRIRWRTLGNYTISHGLYYEMLPNISALFWNKHSWHYWLVLTYTRFITG